MENYDLSQIESIMTRTPGQDRSMGKIENYLNSGDANAEALKQTNLQMVVDMWKSEEIHALKALKSIKQLIDDPSQIVKI